MKTFILWIAAFAIAGVSLAEDLIPIDAADNRVVAEVAITVSADTLPAERTDSFYFVTAARATKEELERRCAQIQDALVSEEKLRPSWGYSASVRAQAASISVELFSTRTDEKKEIEREAYFLLPLFIDSQGTRAGFRYTVTWKRKPNQPPEPTRANAGLRIKPESRVAHL